MYYYGKNYHRECYVHNNKAKSIFLILKIRICIIFYGPNINSHKKQPGNCQKNLQPANNN